MVLSPIKLTKRQTELLQLLKSGDEALVYDKGGGWWVDLEQTSGKTAYWFIYNMLVSEDSYSPDSFYINETGRKALEAGKYFSGFQILVYEEEKRLS